MYEFEFFQFISKWRSSRRFPGTDIWPNTVILGTKTWDYFKSLKKLTDHDAREYAISLFYIDRDVFATEIVKGTEGNVVSKHKLEVEIRDKGANSFERIFYIDGKKIKADFGKSELLKQANAGFLFNVHTHPAENRRDGSRFYSFFSTTDINSLLASQMYMTGLVTDNFWLCCRTDTSVRSVGEIGDRLLTDISKGSFEENADLMELIKEKMQNWGLVFYKASFDQTLTRIF